MSKLTLTLPSGISMVDGKQVTFRAPCTYTPDITHIEIDGQELRFVDAANRPLHQDAFIANSLVSVLIDLKSGKAYMQNIAPEVIIYDATPKQNSNNPVTSDGIYTSVQSVANNLNDHMIDGDIHIVATERTVWNNKYDKPASGIPKADLDSGVQASLGKADTAIQSLEGYATVANSQQYTNEAISAHNISSAAHNDIRIITSDLNDKKINYTDIIDNLTSGDTNKPLSAKQGKVLQDTFNAWPSWSKAATKPEYTKSEVGLEHVDNTSDINKPVSTAQQNAINAVSAEIPVAISEHNIATDAHYDIRQEIKKVADELHALADSDDETLDQLSELIAYMQNNKSLIDGITTSKVNVSDIVNTLTSTDDKKPLSAAQGAVLKGLIDNLPSWSKAAAKPSYTYVEVGADQSGAADAVQGNLNSHASNDTHITAEERVAWNNKLSSFTETDPTVPAWAKAATKPSYTAAEVGALPANTKIPSTASDVGALPANTPIPSTAADVGADPVGTANTAVSTHNSSTTAHNDIRNAVNNCMTAVFVAGTTAPSNTKLLWIDTTPTTGGLKYHNGSSWVGVPTQWI